MNQGADAAEAQGSVTVHREGAVLRVTLDRPSRRNSLTQLMIGTLVDSLTEAACDDSLRAVHIRSAGDDFCAGADWVATNDPGGQRPRAGDLVRRIPHGAHRVIELVAAIQLPVICSVRGWAVGFGCNLALAADFTVAAGDAVFWEPFIDRGFSPDSGSTWLLPRLVGLARARRMLLLGEKRGEVECAAWMGLESSIFTLGDGLSAFGGIHRDERRRMPGPGVCGERRLSTRSLSPDAASSQPKW